MFYIDEKKEIITTSDTPQEGYLQVFEKHDLIEFQGVFEEAEDYWNKITREYVDINGDGGSCVLGAGISILFITKKTPALRGLSSKKVISQPRCCQGSINWEGDRLEKVKAFLSARGVMNVHYNYGWLD